MSFLVISGVFAGTEENPPTGNLKYGSYTHWLDNALEYRDESQDALGNNNTVKQSNSLTTKKGEKVVWILEGKLGIGIQTPQELLDIRSEKQAVLKVESSTGIAKFLFGEGALQVQESEFFIHLGSQKIVFTEEGVNVEGQLQVKNKNVVLANQECPVGQKISGTDEEGNIICKEFIVTVRYCNLNTITLSENITLMGSCKLAPSGSEDGCVLNFSGEKRLDKNCNFKENSCVIDFTGEKRLDGNCNFDEDGSPTPAGDLIGIQYLDFTGDRVIGEYIFAPE